jgi:hypothetical protein
MVLEQGVRMRRDTCEGSLEELADGWWMVDSGETRVCLRIGLQ